MMFENISHGFISHVRVGRMLTPRGGEAMAAVTHSSTRSSENNPGGGTGSVLHR
jgi:hypothetical protein